MARLLHASNGGESVRNQSISCVELTALAVSQRLFGVPDSSPSRPRRFRGAVVNSPKLRSLSAVPKNRRVFSKRPRSRAVSIGRQMLEGVLLLALGSGLLALLSWLPQKVDAMVVVSEAIADLIRGLGQLLEALLGLAAVILIALLLVAGLLALLSGGFRLVKSFTRLLRSERPHQSKVINRRSRPRR